MYETFEHKADMGVRGIGESFEQAFEETAKAMFSIMTGLEKVEAENVVEVEANAKDLEALLVEWLNELVFHYSSKNMFFSEFKVEPIEERADGFYLKGTAKGEEIDQKKHERKTEVKAASYSQLKVAEEGGKFLAQCIVDV